MSLPISRVVVQSLYVEARICVLTPAPIGVFNSVSGELSAQRRHALHVGPEGSVARAPFCLSYPVAPTLDLLSLYSKLQVHFTLEPLDLGDGAEFDFLETLGDSGVRGAGQTISAVGGLVDDDRSDGLSTGG